MKADHTLIGRAFRGEDGVIRWVTWASKRQFYHYLWLDEERGYWYEGGYAHVSTWRAADEVPAPQPGETYTLIGALGTPREMQVPKKGAN